MGEDYTGRYSMKKVAWIVVVILLLTSTSVFAADTLKIGVVNLMQGDQRI